MRLLTASSLRTSAVSLWMKTVIGTPQARWRDSTQSGRFSIIERNRFWPLPGHKSGLVDRGQRARAQGVAFTAQGLVHVDEPLRRVAEDHRFL